MALGPDKAAPEDSPRPHGGISGVAWPAAPTGQAAALLSLLHQFEHTQWWPPDQLQRFQFAQLHALMRHTRETVPFYADRLRKAGFDPDRPLSEAVWRRLPVLTRGDIQSAGARLRSTRPPKAHGKRRISRTSGSTGRPVEVVKTAIDTLMWRAITIREVLWQGRDLSASLAVIRKTASGDTAYPDGMTAGDWNVTGLCYPTGPGHLLSIAASVAEQVDWLRRRDPHYLVTYPSNLRQIVRHCRKAGVRLPRLKGLATLGETVPEDLRALCREAWSLEVADMYSTQETGYIALQCPHGDGYHVQAETALAEVVGEDGWPSGPGEVGRVVVTPLHNFAMPLLRYDIGDYAEVGGPCACGRGLPMWNRILGRVRNVLVTPDGGRYWPSFGSRGLTDIAPVIQHQFVQKSPTTLEARLVVGRPLTGEEEAKLRDHVIARLPAPFTLTFSYPDDIPRSQGGKFEDFVSEVAS